MKKLRHNISRIILMMAIIYMPADAFTQQKIVVSGKVISLTDGA